MAMMGAKYGQNSLGAAIQVIGPDGYPATYSDCGSMESGTCDQPGLPGGTVVTEDTSYFPTNTISDLPLWLGGSSATYNTSVGNTIQQAVNKFNVNTMANGLLVVLALGIGIMLVRK